MRCVALALSILCLAGQLSSFSHHVLVRHATCAEHGELIHPDERGRACPPAAGTSTGRQAEGVFHWTSATAVPVNGHDHCFLLSDRRERITLQRLPAAIEIDPPTTARVGFLEDAEQATSFALYLLAPKNSPPA